MIKKVILIILFFAFYLFVSAQIQPNLYKSIDKKAMEQWVDSIYNSMTIDEKIGQLFMVIADPRSSYHTRIIRNIKEQKIGGVLFSGGNLEDQVESMNLYQKESRIPLFISFDGEWGISMRLKETPRFPKNIMLGAIQDNKWLQLYGEEVGREFNELGVHINFAPMLDVYTYSASPITNTRSYGEDPKAIAEKGIAYASGLENKQVIAVGKHFPGHGGTLQDSHHTVPVIEYDKSRLDSVDIYPFKEFINKGLSGIMTGHLYFPALDHKTKQPTSLSPTIITDLLQNKLQFEGLKITDALVMQGASHGKYSIGVEAIMAGNDILLSLARPAEEFTAVKKAIEKGLINMRTIEEKCLKILRYKYIVGLNNYKPTICDGLKDRINSDYADWLIQKLNSEAITLLKNDNDIIPLKQLAEKKIALVALGETSSNEFQYTMRYYNNFDYYKLNKGEDSNLLFSTLKKYDAIIFSIHSEKYQDLTLLQSLAENKEIHLCFFVAPSQLNKFKKIISLSKSVTLAYENTKHAQKSAAEMIMGGLPAKGKLPVTIAGLFQKGTGIQTEKVRLSYQHPREVGMDVAILGKITSIIEDGIKEKAFPGCQILIAKDQVIVYNKSFGYFDYAKTHKVQNNDIYDLASITKAIATTTAIMKLYDDKKLNLQDQLSKYIPELQNTDKENITIKMALFHESGLMSYYPFYQLLMDKTSYDGKLFSNKRDVTYHIEYDKNIYMRNDFEYLPAMISQTSQKDISVQIAENLYVNNHFKDTIINKIASMELRKNTNYLYSDLNFILLKEVIENITKEPLDKYLEENLFSSLGASTTTFLPLRKFKKEVIAPTEHDKFFRNQNIKGYPHDDIAAVLGGISGNAGLFSSANDLAKILQMLLNNGTYGGINYIYEPTIKLFTQTKSLKSRRGLGFDKPDKDKEVGSTSIQASANTFGHTGYTGTCFWVDPDNNLIFIFLSNRVYPSRKYTKLMDLKIRPIIHNIVYESINCNQT
ncbi:MAG: serine hydrolase [Bacteroidales bacterium]|nr:serine hydrolase [Bacteroidales bacterium]